MAGHAKFLEKTPAPGSRGTRMRETAPQARVDAPRLASPSSTGAPSAPGSTGTVQTLQRLVGNQAVMRMLDVQRAAADLREPSDEAIRAAATEGVRTPSTPLPYLDRIQAGFGRHSVGEIQAHVGPAATRASQAMSAQAYATGNHVVFGARPDLRTAAHEAAHIVQQRAGVQLSGGIGRVGDVFERNADAVADAVVAGHSAEGLLVRNEAAGAHAAGPPIQRRVDINGTDIYSIVNYLGNRWNEIDGERIKIAATMLMNSHQWSFSGPDEIVEYINRVYSMVKLIRSVLQEGILSRTEMQKKGIRYQGSVDPDRESSIHVNVLDTRGSKEFVTIVERSMQRWGATMASPWEIKNYVNFSELETDRKQQHKSLPMQQIIKMSEGNAAFKLMTLEEIKRIAAATPALIAQHSLTLEDQGSISVALERQNDWLPKRLVRNDDATLADKLRAELGKIITETAEQEAQRISPDRSDYKEAVRKKKAEVESRLLGAFMRARAHEANISLLNGEYNPEMRRRVQNTLMAIIPKRGDVETHGRDQVEESILKEHQIIPGVGGFTALLVPDWLKPFYAMFGSPLAGLEIRFVGNSDVVAEYRATIEDNFEHRFPVKVKAPDYGSEIAKELSKVHLLETHIVTG